MNEQRGGKPVIEENNKIIEKGRYESILRRSVPLWGLIIIFATILNITFIALDPGRVESPTPTPTVTVTVTAPPLGIEELEPVGVAKPADGSKMSTELIACASLPIDGLLRSAYTSGYFSLVPAPLEGASAVWRWEMVDVGEMVVISIDTDLIDLSALALLQSPGAVDALAGAKGVLDISVTANSGRWWVGIGTAFSMRVPLSTSQVESSASMIADCMNGAGALKR